MTPSEKRFVRYVEIYKQPCVEDINDEAGEVTINSFSEDTALSTHQPHTSQTGTSTIQHSVCDREDIKTNSAHAKKQESLIFLHNEQSMLGSAEDSQVTVDSVYDEPTKHVGNEKDFRFCQHASPESELCNFYNHSTSGLVSSSSSRINTSQLKHQVVNTSDRCCDGFTEFPHNLRRSAAETQAGSEQTRYVRLLPGQSWFSVPGAHIAMLHIGRRSRQKRIGVPESWQTSKSRQWKITK